LPVFLCCAFSPALSVILGLPLDVICFLSI
jgi:hypothetical protein